MVYFTHLDQDLALRLHGLDLALLPVGNIQREKAAAVLPGSGGAQKTVRLSLLESTMAASVSVHNEQGQKQPFSLGAKA